MNAEQLKVVITAEVAKFKSAMNSVEKELSNVSSEAKKSSGTVSSAMSNLGSAISTGAGVALVGITALVGGFNALQEKTEEYRLKTAGLKIAYEEIGLGADVANEAMTGFYRITGDMGVSAEAASLLGQLAQSEQGVSEWTNIAAGAMALFPDSLPIESLIEASNETAKTGEVTGALADALNWAGVSETEFQAQLSACNTEAEREALIRETLNGLYGAAGEAYQASTSTIGDARQAELELTDTMSQLADALLPLKTMFLEFINNAIGPLIEAISPVIADIMPGLQQAFSAVGEVIGFVLGTVGQIIAFIITAIVEVISWFTNLGENVSNVIQGIVDWFQNLWSSITGVVQGIFSAVSSVFEGIKNAISNAVSNAWNAVTSAFNGIRDGIGNAIETAKSKVASVFEAIRNTIKSKVDAAKQTVTNVFNGIKNAISGAIEGAKNIVGNAIEGIKNFFNFKWEWPKIPLPHFSISGSINPLDWFTQGLPHIGIEWYAKGGVFDKPTVVSGLGEAGAEAIVPLENNPKWIDAIAKRLAGEQAATIVLNVDGKTFAQTAVTSINNLTRAQNRLGLNLV